MRDFNNKRKGWELHGYERYGTLYVLNHSVKLKLLKKQS